MKLNQCKCGCSIPVRKSKKTDTGKLAYYASCPKCKSETAAYYGTAKQKATKEWNKVNPVAAV